MPDYSVLDIPPILNIMFHPRKGYSPCPKNAFDLIVPVSDGVGIAARFYTKGEVKPSVLFFHGNGEVIYDYDDIAPLYNDMGLNLIAADYRGYGTSGGAPSFTNVCKDAKSILLSVKQELAKRNFSGGLWVMGRSLGSLSALELAAFCPDEIKGLIIESGFANAARVMKHWYDFPKEISLRQFDRECLDAVKSITIPTLLLHGDADQVVPYQEAADLYKNLGSVNKKMITISRAGHNDIMCVGMKQYFKEIVSFINVFSG
jgi:pimeloyl-ACP methyl ester carboxylesterase